MSVTADIIADALGRPSRSAAESTQWQVWIDDARLLIKARLGNLDALDQDLLDYVVREAVLAHIRKPDDATQVEVAVDDGRISRRYASSNGRVTILADWIALLAPDESYGGAFTITPGSSGPSVLSPSRDQIERAYTFDRHGWPW